MPHRGAQPKEHLAGQRPAAPYRPAAQGHCAAAVSGAAAGTLFMALQKQVHHFSSKAKAFAGDVMHLLFISFDFSSVFEIAVDNRQLGGNQ